MKHIFYSFILLAASADVVTDWNTVALQAIRVSNTPPPAAARNLAILHVSIYDAVNGIRRTHKPYFVTATGPASASRQAAAARAARKHPHFETRLPGRANIHQKRTAAPQALCRRAIGSHNDPAKEH